MEGQREAMCHALDNWFREHGESQFDSSVRSTDPISYTTVIANSKDSRGWHLQVEGLVGKLEFAGDFLLRVDAEKLVFTAECSSIVRMDERRRKNTAEKAGEQVSQKSDTCDADKALRAAQMFSHTSGERNSLIRQASGIGEQLAKWYGTKQGDLLNELCDNLRAPSGSDVMSTLSGLACSLKTDHGQSDIYGSFNELELIVLRGYTQRPFDIDRDLGWPDAPPPQSTSETSEAADQRTKYEAQHTSWMWESLKPDGGRYRNGSLYAAICSALRDQGPGGKAEAWSEALVVKWIKWICTLCAITITETPSKDSLWRGLGGGGLPRTVVEQHAKLERNGLVAWVAPSSASHNYNTSRSYALGTAVNSKSKPSKDYPGTIMFNIKSVLGLPLQGISQYPKEEEVLISPLTLFAIKAVTNDTANPFQCGLDIEMECLGPLGAPAQETPWLRRFYEKVRKDSTEASARMLEHITKLDLKPKWKQSGRGKGWDIVMKALREQMSTERARLTDKANENVEEVKELRKKAAQVSKLQRSCDLAQAEHEALKQEMKERADKEAAEHLQATSDLAAMTARNQKLETSLERVMKDIASATREAQNDRKERLALLKKAEDERDRQAEFDAVNKTRIASLEKELSDLMITCRSYSNEVVQWKDRYRDAQVGVEDATRKAEQQNAATIRNLRQDLKDLRQHHQEERSLRDAAQADYDRAQQVTISKTEEANRLRTRMEEDRKKHTEELSALTTKYTDTERTAEEMKSIRATEVKEAERIKALLERESRLLRELRKQSDETQSRLSREVTHGKDQLREENLERKKCASENRRLHDLVEEEKQARSECRQKYDALKARIQESSDDHKQVESQLQQRISIMREDAQEAELRHKRDVISLQNNVTKLESQLKSHDDKWKRQQQQELSAAAALRLRLEDSLTSSHAEVESLKHAVSREKAESQRIESLRTQELDQYKGLLRQAERLQESTQTQLKECEKKSLQHNLRMDEEKRKVVKLESHLGEANNKSDLLDGRVRKSEAEIASLRADVDKHEREKSRLETQHRELMEKMNTQMEGLRLTVKQYQSRADAERQVNSDLREESARLRTERDVSLRVADANAFTATQYKDSYDRAVSSPRLPSASPQRSPSPAHSPIRGYGEASPALKRIEATTRRLRREVTSIRAVVPPNLNR